MGCAPWNELENFVCFIAQKDYKISDHKAAHRGRDFHIWTVLDSQGSKMNSLYQIRSKILHGTKVINYIVSYLKKY